MVCGYIVCLFVCFLNRWLPLTPMNHRLRIRSSSEFARPGIPWTGCRHRSPEPGSESGREQPKSRGVCLGSPGGGGGGGEGRGGVAWVFLGGVVQGGGCP